MPNWQLVRCSHNKTSFLWDILTDEKKMYIEHIGVLENDVKHWTGCLPQELNHWVKFGYSAEIRINIQCFFSVPNACIIDYYNFTTIIIICIYQFNQGDYYNFTNLSIPDLKFAGFFTYTLKMTWAVFFYPFLKGMGFLPSICTYPCRHLHYILSRWLCLQNWKHIYE